MPRALPLSFHRLAATDVPHHPPLNGSRKADVCVVGGGFTGLSATLHLAEAGADVVLVEANEVASGASGRSGGQIHSGQRQDVLWLEKRFGFERAKRLWDEAENAKGLLRALIARFAIACDLRDGVIEALHKPSLLPEAEELVAALSGRYGYDRVSLLDRERTAQALGSRLFAGGVMDGGGGHLDPFRFALGLAGAAKGLGAALHENTPAMALERRDGRPLVRTAQGEVSAEQVIVATDGRSGSLEKVTRRHMLGINSFVVITEPLGTEGDSILPGGESAADSRFVVRYWRKMADRRLVFGGGESSAGTIPADVTSFVRPHLAEIYPQLADAKLVHGWGGVVSVTVPRLPYVREIAPAVWAAGGYSGQGVALAPYVGKLLAEAVSGRPERLKAFTEIPIPALPTSRWLRRPMVALAILQGRISDRL